MTKEELKKFTQKARDIYYTENVEKWLVRKTLDEACDIIGRLTDENKELNFRIENLIKRREEFDRNVASLTAELKAKDKLIKELTERLK